MRVDPCHVVAVDETAPLTAIDNAPQADHEKYAAAQYPERRKHPLEHSLSKEDQYERDHERREERWSDHHGNTGASRRLTKKEQVVLTREMASRERLSRGIPVRPLAVEFNTGRLVDLV